MSGNSVLAISQAKFKPAIVQLGAVIPGPFQKRRLFKRAEMEKLVDSLIIEGIINQLVVIDRGDGKYPLLSGERRWRAMCVIVLSNAGHLSRDSVLDLVCRSDGGLQIVQQWAHCLTDLVEVRIHTSRSERAHHHLAVVDNMQNESLSPVEEGLEFFDLKTRYGYSDNKIARITGRSLPIVKGRLQLLQLEQPIQDLIDRDELHRDQRVVEALLKLPVGDIRIKAARHHVQSGSTIQVIVDACERLAENLRRQAERATNQEATTTSEAVSADQQQAAVSLSGASEPAFVPPALELLNLPTNGNGANPFPKPPGYPAPGSVRVSAQESCLNCAIRTNHPLLNRIQEPAWVIVTADATGVCSSCAVRHIRTMCQACPLPNFLRRYIAHYTTESQDE